MSITTPLSSAIQTQDVFLHICLFYIIDVYTLTLRLVIIYKVIFITVH